MTSHQKDHSFLEAMFETGEVISDILMSGDMIAEIPVIGTAFKLCKAHDSIRDRALAAKLASFIKGIETISESTKEKMHQKIKASPKEARQVGETLFLILDRVTDFDKPIILSKLFIAYINHDIIGDELRRMAQAIDASFIDDLRQFIEIQVFPDKSEAEWMQYLVASGLTYPVGGKTYGDIGHIYYEPTLLGQKLRMALDV